MTAKYAINRKRDEKQQNKKARQLKKPPHPNKPPVDRVPATSKGVRQIVSLSRLKGVAKTITVRDNEIEFSWRFKHEDAKSLQMMLLLYEAKGWAVEEQA